jgi:hypothetical protein
MAPKPQRKEPRRFPAGLSFDKELQYIREIFVVEARSRLNQDRASNPFALRVLFRRSGFRFA